MVTASASVEKLSLLLAGLSDAKVTIKFGAGELILGRAAPGELIAGVFEHGVISRIRAPGVIELEPPDPTPVLTSGHTLHWNIGLTAEIPVDLRLSTGANQSKLDLIDLRVPRIELHTGASDTALRLPATGQTVVHIECGFANVVVEVPVGVAARVRGRMGLGALDVDQGRFLRSDEAWLTPGFYESANRVDIRVKGGFGAVRVM